MEVGPGTDCDSTADRYRPRIEQRLAETGGLSAVSITGSYQATDEELRIRATVRLEDPVLLSDLRMTFVAIEDDIFYCCGLEGDSVWNNVTRRIIDTPITLTNPGDEALVDATVSILPHQEVSQFRVIAFLQQTTGEKEIFQATQLPCARGLTLRIERPVRSVPQGNGTAYFPATLCNIGANPEDFLIGPSTPFLGWGMDYLICGDPEPHTSVESVPLAPGDPCPVVVRVQTDGNRGARSGSFRAETDDGALSMVIPLKVFNRSYANFVVDDDLGNDDNLMLTSLLGGMGQLYTGWDMAAHDYAAPVAGDYAGYDQVIWSTGWSYWLQHLSPAAALQLEAYLNLGGAIFVAGQAFYGGQNGAPLHIFREYLGSQSAVADLGADELLGGAGDPIGQGLDLELNYETESRRRGDDITPTASATVVLTSPEGVRAMVRNETGRGVRCVFLSQPFNALSTTDPDPNNARMLLQRILGWLQESHPADAPDVRDVRLTAAGPRLLVFPNPQSAGSGVWFRIEGAPGPCDVGIFDPGGRRIALIEGSDMGSGFGWWDGRDDRGVRVASGIYMARVVSSVGRASAPVVLVR
jgi:hypothetical protein